MSMSLRANADGSGTLLNGATPVMEVSAAGVVSLPNIAAGSSANQPVNFGQVVGIGQTWQDVTASRATGVTYTNSTGKPIQVIVTTTTNNQARFFVNGVLTATAYYGGVAGASNSLSVIVPNGSNYNVQSGDGVLKWMELR